MTRLEYELAQDQNPHLGLPAYIFLSDQHRILLSKLSEDQLIARRTAVILSRDYTADPTSPNMAVLDEV